MPFYASDETVEDKQPDCRPVILLLVFENLDTGPVSVDVTGTPEHGNYVLSTTTHADAKTGNTRSVHDDFVEHFMVAVGSAVKAENRCGVVQADEGIGLALLVGTGARINCDAVRRAELRTNLIRGRPEVLSLS